LVDLTGLRERSSQDSNLEGGKYDIS
jgi:hypothetical protein